MKGIAKPLYGLMAIIAIVAGTILSHDRLDLDWPAAYLLAINGVTMVFYAVDKLLVKLLELLKLRVPEAILIWLLALFGGWPGAVITMLMLGHKTGPAKRAFRMQLLLAIVGSFLLLLLFTLLRRLAAGA